jgi:general secretion pathway protein B
MSYILDALRKADAQRERSRTPGLNDRPLGADDGEARDGHSPLLWGVLGVGLVSIGLAAWQLAGTRAPAAPVVAQAAPTAPTAPPVPAPVAPAAPAVPPAPAARIEPPPPPPAAVAPAPPPVPAAQRPAPPTRREASAPAAAAEPSAVAPADAPKLAITGGVYSQNASQRMLIVNGQVFSEGSAPVAGVVLEQIRPNQAVLNWRGQRYLVPY